MTEPTRFSSRESAPFTFDNIPQGENGTVFFDI